MVPVTSLKKRIVEIKKYLLILFLYALITTLLTYPVLFTIGNAIPGQSDVYNSLYVLWHTHLAVFTNQTTLTHNFMLFWPDGIPRMAFGSAFNQILAVILLQFLSLTTTYTLLWLLTFVIGAFGAYLLVDYLTRSSVAAFIAGIAFAFSPFHFVHAMGHQGAATIQWIPFCALFLMMMFRENNLKYSVLAGIFCILVGMSDLQYLVFMGIFVGLLFLVEVCTKEIRQPSDISENIKNILKKYLLFGLIVCIGILPLVSDDIAVATSSSNYLKPSPGEAALYSADLFSFFLPSVQHPVFNSITKPINHNFSGNWSENTTFIGYTILVLSLYALWKLRKQIEVKFWLLSAVVFSIFSLGPILHINGKTIFTVFNTSTTIPLPYAILSQVVPFLENSRTPGRIFVFASLAFAVLAGYGIAELLRVSSTRKNLLPVLVCGLIVFEFLSIPVMMSSVDQPVFYKNISLDNTTYALLEIPATLMYGAGMKIEYYQTIHGKPIVGGQAGRMPADARNFEKSTPFIREITFLDKSQKDIVNQNITGVGNSILQHYNIRYVILHKDFLSHDQLQAAESLLAQWCNPPLPKVYEDKRLVVYEQNRTAQNHPFVILGTGWNEIENLSGGTPMRWMKSNATLIFYSDQNRSAMMSMQVSSFYHPRTLNISVEEQHIVETTVLTRFTTITLPVDLHKGENILNLQVEEGCDQPNAITNLKSSDKRCLNIAVKNITVK